MFWKSLKNVLSKNLSMDKLDIKSKYIFVSKEDIKSKYIFVSKVDDKWASICIKGGKFDGVIYKYGKVSIPEEENEDGALLFKFEYDILDNVGISREDFDEEFFTLIGDILVDIIDEQIEEDNFEYASND